MTKELNYFTLDLNRPIEIGYLKSMWRKIAVALHPDKGGDENKFKEALTEYDYLLEHVGAIFTAAQDSPDNYDNWADFFANVSPAVKECYTATYAITGITHIEICGQWIWVKLDKTQIDERAALKEIAVNNIKYRFSRNKLMWYWAGRKSTNKGKKFSMDDIRNYHGSKSMKKKENEQITV